MEYKESTDSFSEYLGRNSLEGITVRNNMSHSLGKSHTQRGEGRREKGRENRMGKRGLVIECTYRKESYLCFTSANGEESVCVYK